MQQSLQSFLWHTALHKSLRTWYEANSIRQNVRMLIFELNFRFWTKFTGFYSHHSSPHWILTVSHRPSLYIGACTVLWGITSALTGVCRASILWLAPMPMCPVARSPRTSQGYLLVEFSLVSQKQHSTQALFSCSRDGTQKRCVPASSRLKMLQPLTPGRN